MQEKLINLIGALFLGVSVSIIGGFLQAGTFQFFVTIPLGYILYLVIFIYSIRYLRSNLNSRIFIISYAIGWLIIALLMSTKLRAGDLVLTNNLLAITYLLSSVIILGAMSTLPLKK
jgi:hypothetical protein